MTCMSEYQIPKYKSMKCWSILVTRQLLAFGKGSQHPMIWSRASACVRIWSWCASHSILRWSWGRVTRTHPRSGMRTVQKVMVENITNGHWLVSMCYRVNPIWGSNKDKLVLIWVTCKICKFKTPGCKAYGVKTQAYNYPSQCGCVKHVEKIYCYRMQEICMTLSRIQ